MNKMPIIVSHYTKNTGYEKEVQNLITSLEKLGLKYDIEGIESLGTWRENSNYCTENVRKMMARYPNNNILRVDADAVFQRNPDIFLREDFDADVAAHIHDFRWRAGELMGGTLFFKNTPTVRWLVDHWVWKSRIQHPTKRNGDLLKLIIFSRKFNIKFTELPATYCKIFDIMKKVKKPVIEHFQASRRFKQEINRQGIKKK